MNALNILTIAGVYNMLLTGKVLGYGERKYGHRLLKTIDGQVFTRVCGCPIAVGTDWKAIDKKTFKLLANGYLKSEYTSAQ